MKRKVLIIGLSSVIIVSLILATISMLEHFCVKENMLLRGLSMEKVDSVVLESWAYGSVTLTDEESEKLLDQICKIQLIEKRKIPAPSTAGGNIPNITIIMKDGSQFGLTMYSDLDVYCILDRDMYWIAYGGGEGEQEARELYSNIQKLIYEYEKKYFHPNE